jgi:hypothetical protein
LTIEDLLKIERVKTDRYITITITNLPDDSNVDYYISLISSGNGLPQTCMLINPDFEVDDVVYCVKQDNNCGYANIGPSKNSTIQFDIRLGKRESKSSPYALVPNGSSHCITFNVSYKAGNMITPIAIASKQVRLMSAKGPNKCLSFSAVPIQ